ncbi:hypothetical protein ABBQ32_002596 [Trebouxia sp. C0010 RCD-2024]
MLGPRPVLNGETEPLQLESPASQPASMCSSHEPSQGNMDSTAISYWMLLTISPYLREDSSYDGWRPISVKQELCTLFEEIIHGLGGSSKPLHKVCVGLEALPPWPAARKRKKTSSRAARWNNPRNRWRLCGGPVVPGYADPSSPYLANYGHHNTPPGFERCSIASGGSPNGTGCQGLALQSAS